MKPGTRAAILLAVFILLTGTANATLRVIGTATYNGIAYKLIWDDDNNGRSVVWLDFANGRLTHDAQLAWASGLSFPPPGHWPRISCHVEKPRVTLALPTSPPALARAWPACWAGY